MENKQVRIIQPKKKFEINENGDRVLKLKKVCAYCRVSTDNDEQKTSVDYQVDEYTKRIQENPEWEFVGIFTDEGISGTSTKHRKQFNEMINLARHKQVDLILTKSISRFTRNTVDCLNYIRELRAIGVEIYFEKENIYSSDTKVDFLLTIMSSIAQEEARNTSENVKWTVQKRFKEGKPILNHNRFLGYTKDKKGGQLIIVEEEAKIVRELFALYSGGIGHAEIIRIFQSKGYKTGAGKTKWMNSTIDSMLKNEKYCGNLLLQKTITQDYLSHKRVKNVDLAPMYHIENSHEPIVDKETFNMVQQIRKDRSRVRVGENKNLSKYTRRYPLSGYIYCGKCGKTLKRRYWNYGRDSEKIVMHCGGYLEGKENCSSKAIDLDLIQLACIKVINEVFLSNIDVMKEIYRSILSAVDVNQTEFKIEKINDDISELELKIESLVDLKINNEITKELFNSKYSILTSELRQLEKKREIINKENEINFDKNTRVLKMKEILKNTNKIESLDLDVLRAFIYRMIATDNENITFCIAVSKYYNDDEFAKNIKSFIKHDTISLGKVMNAKNKTLNYRVVAI